MLDCGAKREKVSRGNEGAWGERGGGMMDGETPDAGTGNVAGKLEIKGKKQWTGYQSIGIVKKP